MKTVNYLIILFLSCWFILKSIKTDSQICQKGGVFRLLTDAAGAGLYVLPYNPVPEAIFTR